MKKIVNLLFATVVVALASVSCQKKEVAVDVNEDVVVALPVYFHATEIVTKTTFGTLSEGKYPTLWTSTNGIKISQNKATSIDASVTPTSGGVTADFTPASPIVSDGSDNYIFYALSPASSHVSKINPSYNSWNVEIPSSQTPLANSVDESAQVLVARYDAGTTYPSSVPFDFHHVTAYGKLSFANLSLDSDEDVTGVTLTAQSNWVGRWYYYVEDYDAEPDGTPENEAGTLAPSSASKTLSLVTTSTSGIWFACAPVDLRSKTLTAIVATNKGTYTKEITFPEDKGNFQAGHVSSFTINMSGVARVSPVVYTEVTDVASLTVGSEIIITNATSTYAAGQRGSGSFLPHQAVTVSESKISDPSASVEVYTIGNGNIAGTYSLQSASDSKYLSWSSGSSVGGADSVTDVASWAIVISGGTTTIRNMSDNTRYLLYHSENTRFTTYLTSTGGVSNVKIWKKNGTGSGAITAKVPTEIEVVGVTTEYAKAAVYAFDGTVNLLYSDLSKGTLTSSDYTVSPGSIDTSTGGVYTVTVTYNEDASIKTTYDVIVGGLTVVYDFTDSANYPGTISTSGNAASSATEFTFGTNKLTIKANNSCYRINASAPFALFWGKSKKNDIPGSSYIEIPGKSGYKMVRVTITNGANCAVNVNVNIYDSSNTVKSTSVKTVKGGSMAFNVTSPVVNTPYKISSGDDGKNFQFASITVIYVES